MDDMFLPNDTYLRDPKAQRLWDELVISYNSYPSDSSVAKFFLPEELVILCRPVAAAFTSAFYHPALNTKEVYASQAYLLFLLATVCGIQLFLRERALLKNYEPYKLKTKQKEIIKAKEHALFLLNLNSSLPKPAQLVKQKFLIQLSSVRKIHNLELTDKEFYQDRFLPLSESCINWGYFFAQEMVLPYS